MAHKYIVGMTESGKSTLAKLMCMGLNKRGLKIAVLDKLRSTDWQCENVFEDPFEFLEFAKNNEEFFLFVDEGGQAIGRYNEEMEWLATESRHKGHSCIFISQSLTQVAPIVREQSMLFFLFACGEKNTTLLAEECREPLVKKLLKIPKLEFYIVSRFSALEKGKIIFPQKGKLPLDKLRIEYNEVGNANVDNAVGAE